MKDNQLFRQSIERLHTIANTNRKDLTVEHRSVFPCLDGIDKWAPRKCQHFRHSMVALEEMDSYRFTPEMKDHMAIGLLGIYSLTDLTLPQEETLLLADFLSDYSYDHYPELLSFFANHDLLNAVKEKTGSDLGDATIALGEIEKYYLRHSEPEAFQNELSKQLFQLKTYHQTMAPEGEKEEFYRERLLDSLKKISDADFRKWLDDRVSEAFREGGILL